MSRSKAFDTALSLINAEIVADKLKQQIKPVVIEKEVIVEKLVAPPKPKGVVLPLTINVTDQFTDAVGEGAPPWFSFDLYNQGANPVYAMVNQQRKGRNIPSGASWRIKMRFPQIKHLYLICDAGLSAEVNVDGVY